MVSKISRTRENLELPDEWFSSIEKSREKAKKLLKRLIAVNLNTSIIVGRLEDVGVDKLWRLKYPFCKLTLSKPEKYNMDGKLESKLGDEQVCFISKPQMIMDIDELSERYPEIHEEVHIRMRKEGL